MFVAILAFLVNNLIGLAVGFLLGITFYEGGRRVVRKITRGRFFGAVPAKS